MVSIALENGNEPVAGEGTAVVRPRGDAPPAVMEAFAEKHHRGIASDTGYGVELTVHDRSRMAYVALTQSAPEPRLGHRDRRPSATAPSDTYAFPCAHTSPERLAAILRRETATT